MFRLVGAAVAATMALAGMPAMASAAQAPPALSGEALSTSLSTDGPTVPFTLPCGGSPTFNFSGTATGPYSGSFIESGTASYSGPCWPPTVATPVTAYSAQFTIDTPAAVVTGTETMAGPALAESYGGDAINGETVGPVPTDYTATITTATGTYHDSGTSTSTLNEGFNPDGWFGILNAAPFAALATPVPTQPLTLSNMVATVEPSGNVAVSVDASSNIINVVLYQGNYDKVAADDTPVGGVASWKVTGLTPGTHTLYAQGFSVPSGHPGGQISPAVGVTVVIPTPSVSSPAPIPTPTPGPGPTPSPTPTPTTHAKVGLSAYLQASFKSDHAYTEVLGLLVRKVPAGATVRVTCTGRGCPYGSETLVAKHAGTINLQPSFRHHRLRVGDRITVTISHRGASRRYTYTIRARKVAVADK